MIKNSWIFPFIQSIHLCGIAMLVGSIVILDLRLLEYALRRHSVSEVAERFARWTQIGFTIILTTGPILFISDVDRYVHNPAFLFKMVILVLALMHHWIARRSKLAAVISIVLWTCVVLGGRAIADFDI